MKNNKFRITKIHRRPTLEGMRLWCYLDGKLMSLADAQKAGGKC